MTKYEKRRSIAAELAERVDAFGLLVEELQEVCDKKALFREQLDVIIEYLEEIPEFINEKGAA